MRRYLYYGLSYVVAGAVAASVDFLSTRTAWLFWIGIFAILIGYAVIVWASLDFYSFSKMIHRFRRQKIPKRGRNVRR